MKHARGCLLLMLVALVATGSSSAQPFPNKPITFVFGFPPGTSLDAVARPVADEMAKRLGQPIVFEFKPGASGTIGAKYVANAKPDGYTLFYSNVLTNHPLFVRANSVDPAKELTPVSQFAKSPHFFLVRGDFPARTFQEFVAHAKANPGRVTFAYAAATTELAMQLLANQLGFKVQSIPYKGTPPTVTALLAKEVDATSGTIQPFRQLVLAGKIRALFTAASQRYAALPDVPTNTEAGVPNFELASNNGLWAPVGTPAAVIATLSGAAIAVLKTPSMIERLRTVADAEAVGSTPGDYRRIHDNEVRFWTEAARIANYQPPQ